MNVVRRNQLLYFVVAIVLGVIGYRGFTKPGKATPQENADSVQKPAATDVVLMTPIGLVSKAGDVMQLRETDPSGCTFVGSLTPDFAIAVEHKRCGDIVDPASFVLPLSRTHTYAGVDGALRSGYGAGDRFVIRAHANNQ